MAQAEYQNPTFSAHDKGTTQASIEDPGRIYESLQLDVPSDNEGVSSPVNHSVNLPVAMETRGRCCPSSMRLKSVLLALLYLVTVGGVVAGFYFTWRRGNNDVADFQKYINKGMIKFL